MKKTTISRRAVLRGALIGGGVATIPLPRLGAMLNSHGTAYAATGKSIQRFGVYFIGNGFLPSTFAPRPWVTGPLNDLGKALAPLAKVKSKITAVSGFDVKLLREKGTPHCHFIGALTAAPPSGQIYKLPSIDQVIALQGPLGKDTAYKSLEVGGTARSGGVRASNVSGKGPNQNNVTDYSPSSVFARMFKNFTPTMTNPAGNTTPAPIDPTVALDKSILDSVRLDAADLSKRLGKDDQVRLAVHLDGIRAIEKRLDALSQPRTTSDAACRKTDVTMGASGDGLDPKQVDVMDQVLVMAMACDLTRVFTYTLTKPAAHINYGISGVTGDFHGLSHGGNEAQMTTGHAYTMGMFGGLLEKMDAIQEGAGTMLDNSAVMISTCVSWPAQHTPWEWPCVIGGRGGLRADGSGKYNLAGGWHYRSESGGDNFSKVLLTLANMHGCGLKELGMAEGHVDTEVLGIRGPG
jgi:hypothetical protein